MKTFLVWEWISMEFYGWGDGLDWLDESRKKAEKKGEWSFFWRCLAGAYLTSIWIVNNMKQVVEIVLLVSYYYMLK